MKQRHLFLSSALLLSATKCLAETPEALAAQLELLNYSLWSLAAAIQQPSETPSEPTPPSKPLPVISSASTISPEGGTLLNFTRRINDYNEKTTAKKINKETRDQLKELLNQIITDINADPYLAQRDAIRKSLVKKIRTLPEINELVVAQPIPIPQQIPLPIAQPVIQNITTGTSAATQRPLAIATPVPVKAPLAATSSSPVVPTPKAPTQTIAPSALPLKETPPSSTQQTVQAPLALSLGSSTSSTAPRAKRAPYVKNAPYTDD